MLPNQIHTVKNLNKVIGCLVDPQSSTMITQPYTWHTTDTHNQYTQLIRGMREWRLWLSLLMVEDGYLKKCLSESRQFRMYLSDLKSVPK